DMNTSTYIFTNNSLSALLKDLSLEEEHQILGGTKILHKPVCKSKLIKPPVKTPPVIFLIYPTTWRLD
ncbi:MAG: hypothetical protein ACYTX0_59210, partial [Nostoc sp.]